MVNCVEIRVTKINADGSNSEAEAFGASSDNDGCIESVDQGWQVPKKLKKIDMK